MHQINLNSKRREQLQQITAETLSPSQVRGLLKSENTAFFDWLYTTCFARVRAGLLLKYDRSFETVIHSATKNVILRILAGEQELEQHDDAKEDIVCLIIALAVRRAADRLER